VFTGCYEHLPSVTESLPCATQKDVPIKCSDRRSARRSPHGKPCRARLLRFREFGSRTAFTKTPCRQARKLQQPMPEERMENKPPDAHIDRSHQLPSAGDSHKSSGNGRSCGSRSCWCSGLFLAGVASSRRQPKRRSVAARSRRSVTLTTATAQKGNIGVYLDAIGTVTPIYTDSITSEVTGLVSQVHYTEGQLVRKGQALIDIDARPSRRNSCSEGTLERDTYVLEQAKMDCNATAMRGEKRDSQADARRSGKDRAAGPGNGQAR